MSLVAADRTLIGKEFHARGPATEKALSLRCSLVPGTQKLPRELERNRVSEPKSLKNLKMPRNVIAFSPNPEFFACTAQYSTDDVCCVQAASCEVDSA